jgi:hypothetical protein
MICCRSVNRVSGGQHVGQELRQLQHLALDRQVAADVLRSSAAGSRPRSDECVRFLPAIPVSSSWRLESMPVPKPVPLLVALLVAPACALSQCP